jgi:hypothetical protein
MTDISQKPEIEYDDSTEGGSLTLTWWNRDRTETLSVVLRDGSVIGVHSARPGVGPFAPWKFELPKGLIKIDCSVMQNT